MPLRSTTALVWSLAFGFAACALPHPSTSGGDTGNGPDVQSTEGSASDVAPHPDTPTFDTTTVDTPDVTMVDETAPDVTVIDVPPDLPPDLPPDIPPPIDIVDVTRDVTMPPPDTGCGAVGQPCCPGSGCQTWSFCGSAGYCIACGDNGDRCCAGSACQDPSAHCGMVPNHAAARCIFSSTTIGTTAGDRCVSACVGTNVICDGDTTTDYCILCGTRSLSCCPGFMCTDGTSCDGSNCN